MPLEYRRALKEMAAAAEQPKLRESVPDHHG